jgi:hypothetical protein
VQSKEKIPNKDTLSIPRKLRTSKLHIGHVLTKKKPSLTEHTCHSLTLTSNLAIHKKALRSPCQKKEGKKKEKGGTQCEARY